MKGHVLVIEDDCDIREIIIQFLESEGYQVDTAPDGLAALLYLRQAKKLPQVILLDLMMPKMDGAAFRREQVKDPKLRTIPVLLMSADSQIEAMHRKMNTTGLIKKPIDIDELSDLLDHMISENQSVYSALC